MQNIDTFFNDNGFKFPETDLTRKEKLLPIGNYRWSTLNDLPPAYLLGTFLEDLEKEERAYLVVSHEGHGVNSWFFHYYSVDKYLAYFMQLPFGNALGDIEYERDVIAGGLLTLDDVRKKLQETKTGSQRKVIVDSFITGRRFGWQKNGVIEWNTKKPTSIIENI